MLKRREFLSKLSILSLASAIPFRGVWANILNKRPEVFTLPKNPEPFNSLILINTNNMPIKVVSPDQKINNNTQELLITGNQQNIQVQYLGEDYGWFVPT